MGNSVILEKSAETLFASTRAQMNVGSAPVMLDGVESLQSPGGLEDVWTVKKFPTGIRAVCFDFDGTTALTEPFHRCAILGAKELALGRRLTKSEVEACASAWGLPNQVSCAIVAEAASQAKSQPVEASFIDQMRLSAFEKRFSDSRYGKSPLTSQSSESSQYMRVMMTLKLKPNPGVREMLLALKARNIPTVICTGSTRNVVWPMVKEMQLDLLFNEELSVFADDYSADQAKPDARPYEIAVERLSSLVPGLQAREVLTCEDTVGGTRSARRAGLGHVLLVPSCRYGDVRIKIEGLVAQEPSHTMVSIIPRHGPNRELFGLKRIDPT
ncbi:MAG: hypothetical protein RIS36_870 [Pseudomonadota bacterium]|jgi:beta-phosphoglucomutase-like phosphatase (HAD superfamily)